MPGRAGRDQLAAFLKALFSAVDGRERAAVVFTRRAAWRDAGALDVTAASMRLACTVLYSDQEIDPATTAGRTLRKLAGMSDWSWRISHDGDLPPCYVFLKRRRRRNRG